MKITPIAVAVAAAMFSLSAVATDQKQQSQSGGASAPSSAASSSSSEQPKAASSKSEAKQAQNPELIKQAQAKLNEQGHDVGTPDGKLGQRTQTGIKAFQTSKGIKASGQLDQQTITALGVSESASAGGSAAMKSDDKGQASAGSEPAGAKKQ